MRNTLDLTDPSATPPLTWRAEIRLASGLNVIVAAALVFGPIVLDQAGDGPLWDGVTVGVACLFLALSRWAPVGRAPRHWSHMVALLGLVAATLALVLEHESGARWLQFSSGALLLVLGSLSAWASQAAELGRGAESSAGVPNHPGS